MKRAKDEKDWAVEKARGKFSGRENSKVLETERIGLGDSRVSAHLARCPECLPEQKCRVGSFHIIAWTLGQICIV